MHDLQTIIAMNSVEATQNRPKKNTNKFLSDLQHIHYLLNKLEPTTMEDVDHSLDTAFKAVTEAIKYYEHIGS